MYAILLLIIFCAVIFYFASPKLNPVGYYPTNTDDIAKIIHNFELKDNQAVIDLGAGTGTLVFEAAYIAYNKGFNTRFIAVDINIFLIGVIWLRRLIHPNKQNITIIWGDMFKYHFASKLKKYKHLTFYLYLSPWLAESVAKLIMSLEKPVRVVSYYYPLKLLKEGKRLSGVHPIFVYHVN